MAYGGKSLGRMWGRWGRGEEGMLGRKGKFWKGKKGSMGRTLFAFIMGRSEEDDRELGL